MGSAVTHTRCLRSTAAAGTRGIAGECGALNFVASGRRPKDLRASVPPVSNAIRRRKVGIGRSSGANTRAGPETEQEVLANTSAHGAEPSDDRIEIPWPVPAALPRADVGLSRPQLVRQRRLAQPDRTSQTAQQHADHLMPWVRFDLSEHTALTGWMCFRYAHIKRANRLEHRCQPGQGNGILTNYS